jgi:hypothetical protein
VLVWLSLLADEMEKMRSRQSPVVKREREVLVWSSLLVVGMEKTKWRTSPADAQEDSN